MERVFRPTRLGASVLLLIAIPLFTAPLVDGRDQATQAHQQPGTPGSAVETPVPGPPGPTRSSNEDPNPRDWARSVVDTLSLPRIAGKVLLVQDEAPPPFSPVADPDDPLVDALDRTEAGGAYVCLSDLGDLRSRVRRIRAGDRLPVALYLDPRCSMREGAQNGLQAGWTTALLASRDPTLARQIGQTLGRAARRADLDGVYVPRLARSIGSELALRPADSIRRSARTLEREMRAGIREAGLAVARADTGYRASAPSDRAVGSVARATASSASPSTARSNTQSTGHSAALSTLKADSIARAVQQAVRAGAPRVVVPLDDRTAQRALVRAVRRGELAEGRLRLLAEQALAEAYRIRRSAYPPTEGSADSRVLVSQESSTPHRADSLRSDLDREVGLLQGAIDRRSVTLLRNQGELIPRSPTDSLRILHVAVHGRIGAETDRRTLTDELRRAGPRARLTHRSIRPETRGTHYRAIAELAADQDLVVVSVASGGSDRRAAASPVHTSEEGAFEPGAARLTTRQRSWIDNLNESAVPLVLVGLNAPHLADALDRPEALFLTYTAGATAHRALAQALFGRTDVRGQLPGHLSSSYRTGHGVQLTQQHLRRGPPETAGMDRSVLNRIDQVLRRAVADSAFPGAALAVGRSGVLVKLEGYGHHTYESLRPITPESPFDLASLTKVVATTPAVMELYESDRLSLDAPVTEYWPAFGANGKERVTVRHLLTHTSGLRPFHHPVHLVPGNPFARLPLPYTPFYRMEMLERSDMFGFIARDTLQYTPGTEQVYSDLGMITMAHLVERITDRPLGDFLEEQLYDPLGMDDTGFRKTGPSARSPHVVPTERDYSFRLRTMRGEVHDEAAYIMGGTSGHAGLFSTAQDLALYADMWIRSGQRQNPRLYRRATIDLFTRPVSPDRHTRALGWDTKSPDGYSSAGDLFGPESFGHTGFTGTSLWIDPEQELFVVLLTNRVHPNRFNRKHIEIRPKVADLAYRALRSATTTLAEAPTR